MAALDESYDRQTYQGRGKGEEATTRGLDDNIAAYGAQLMQLVRQRSEELKSEREGLEAERKAFADVTAKLKDTTKFGSRIKLNVGGKVFTTSLETLRMREPRSFLAVMFSGDWKPDTDDQGAFFIDRDGKQFRVLLNYLRTGELVWPSDEAHRREIELELEFFQFENYNGYECEEQRGPMAESLILATHQQEQLVAWRQQSRGRSAPMVAGAPEGCPDWQLLYRMSRDGAQFGDFTERCANKGETFLVARSGQGHCFGCYASASWYSSGRVHDPLAFVFALASPHGGGGGPYMSPVASVMLHADARQVAFSANLVFIGSMAHVVGNAAIMGPFSGPLSQMLQEVEVWGTK